MTELRKSIEEEKWNKLLLSEASVWQIIRQLHKNDKVVLFECVIVALCIGGVLGASL